MRIAYLIQQFPPEVGAGPARALELATRWRDRGADVTIVTAMPNRPQGRIYDGYRGRLIEEDEWDGLRVLRSWVWASPDPGAIGTVANNVSFLVAGALHGILRVRACDVAIASSPPFLVHLAGEAFRRARRVPLVLETRDLWPDYMVDMGVVRGRTARRALFGLERSLYARADHVVVTSESFRERVVGKGVDGADVTVIPNGVDLERYRFTDEPPPVAALERRNGEFVIGYLGNFGQGQALEVVVRAMDRLERDGVPVRMVWTGDGPERARVEAEIAARGVERIEVHDPIPKEATRAYYNACDACLVPLAPYPILETTIPSKLFEIMACERPVVAAVAGEAARIVETSRAGLVASPGEPDTIARAIRRMVEANRDDRRAMGRAGRAWAARHVDRSDQADAYLDLLRGLAA